MSTTYLDFEKPIAELDAKIAELEALSGQKGGPSIKDELNKLKAKSTKQAITGQFLEILENGLDIIGKVRTIRVTRDLGLTPG